MASITELITFVAISTACRQPNPHTVYPSLCSGSRDNALATPIQTESNAKDHALLVAHSISGHGAAGNITPCPVNGVQVNLSSRCVTGYLMTPDQLHKLWNIQ